MLLGQSDQRLAVHGLDVAAVLRPNGPRCRLPPVRQWGRRRFARFVFAGRFANSLREQPVNRRKQFTRNICNDLVGLNRARNVLDEVDQHADAGDGKRDPACDGQVRHEKHLFDAAHGPQHEQAVQERRQERAQHDLIPGVAQKAA
jgi:hypothetical protein